MSADNKFEQFLANISVNADETGMHRTIHPERMQAIQKELEKKKKHSKKLDKIILDQIATINARLDELAKQRDEWEEKAAQAKDDIDRYKKELEDLKEGSPEWLEKMEQIRQREADLAEYLDKIRIIDSEVNDLNQRKVKVEALVQDYEDVLAISERLPPLTLDSDAATVQRHEDVIKAFDEFEDKVKENDEAYDGFGVNLETVGLSTSEKLTTSMFSAIDKESSDYDSFITDFEDLSEDSFSKPAAERVSQNPIVAESITPNFQVAASKNGAEQPTIEVPQKATEFEFKFV